MPLSTRHRARFWRLVPVRQLKMSDGIVRETEVMRVTLSSDHRVINGAQAAAFLAVFKDYMEQPMELLFLII